MNPSTCQCLRGCHCTPNSEVVSTKPCLYPSPSTTLLCYTYLISRTSDLYQCKTQTFVAQPQKVRDAWIFTVIFYLSRYCLSIQGLYWQSWYSDFLFPILFFPPNIFLTWTNSCSHCRRQGSRPKLAVKEVTGWDFTGAGISPDFPKLYKKISVQCELKLLGFQFLHL